MADIKQAAKWIRQRKNVRRKVWDEGYIWFTLDEVIIGDCPQGDRTPAWIGVKDLLADDWEIAVVLAASRDGAKQPAAELLRRI